MLVYSLAGGVSQDVGECKIMLLYSGMGAFTYMWLENEPLCLMESIFNDVSVTIFKVSSMSSNSQ